MQKQDIEHKPARITFKKTQETINIINQLGSLTGIPPIAWNIEDDKFHLSSDEGIYIPLIFLQPNVKKSLYRLCEHPVPPSKYKISNGYVIILPPSNRHWIYLETEVAQQWSQLAHRHGTTRPKLLRAVAKVLEANPHLVNRSMF